MLYTLVWYYYSDLPLGMFHEKVFRGGCLDAVLTRSLLWWRSNCDSELFPVDELIDHPRGVYAYLSDCSGVTVAYLVGKPFKWEVRK